MGGGLRGLGGGQEQSWDQRSDMEGSEQEVTNKGQWLVGNIGAIGESGDCQHEEKKAKKKAILLHQSCICLNAPQPSQPNHL